MPRDDCDMMEKDKKKKEHEMRENERMMKELMKGRHKDARKRG